MCIFRMPADPSEEVAPQVPKTELEELQINAQGVADEVSTTISCTPLKVFEAEPLNAVFYEKNFK